MALTQKSFGSAFENPGDGLQWASPSSSPSSEVPVGPSQTNKDMSRFISRIGNQDYYIEAGMYNLLEGYEPFFIDVKFIEELVIEEQIDDWNAKGWITINTDYEVLERGVPSGVYYDNSEVSKKIKNPYMTRTDGRNLICIRISPIRNNIHTGEGTDYDFNAQNWEMVYNFVIYDIEDLPTEKAFIKKRRYYFWDERYQILLERNLEWSTSTHGPNAGNPSGTDEQRSMPISKAIQSIIKTAASNKFKQDADSDVTVGFGEYKSEFALFSDEWDGGVSSEESNNTEGNVLYTSPANASAIDDINYMLSLFKSEDGTPAIITLDRFFSKEGKRFGLKSYKKIILEAEDNQIERLYIDDLVDPENFFFLA